MATVSNRLGYSIAAVSKLTGVSCHALRVWERRYGFPVPNRSPSGHRRYGKEQVGVLRDLAKQTRSGHLIGELISKYRASKLETLVEDERPVEEKSLFSPVVDCLFKGDMVLADALIDGLAQRTSMMELIERLIEPILVDIGERWFRGEAQIFQERCATSSIIARLGWMLGQARRANTNPLFTVLVGAVEGDHHEGGVLMACLSLEVAGCRAVPLGVDVPVLEFQKAVETWRPDALALSFVLSRNINKRFLELSKIRSVPVFVGGRSLVNHHGLARRYGLIPLIGSLRASTTQLIEEVEESKRQSSFTRG